MIKNILNLIIIIFLLGVVGCEIDENDLPDPDELAVNPSLSVPITSGDLKISSLLCSTDKKILKTFIATDKEVMEGKVKVGDYYYLYKDSTLQDFEEAFKIEDKEEKETVSIGSKTIGSGQSEDLPIIEQGFSLELLSQAALQTIDVSQGEMILSVTSPNNDVTYNYTFTFPSLKDNNGNEITLTGQTTRDDPSIILQQSLIGATIDLTKGNTTNNMFSYVINIRAENTQSSPLNAGGDIDLEFGFKINAFDKMTGQFVEQRLEPADPIYLFVTPCNDTFKDSDYSIEEAFIDVVFSYPAGIDLGVDIKEILVTKENEAPLDIETSLGTSIVLSGGSRDKPSETTTSMTNNEAVASYNPELFVLKQQTSLALGATAITANTPISTIKGTDKIKTVAIVKVPLYGQIKNLEIKKTFNKDAQEISNITLKKGLLKIKAINEYSLEGTVKVEIIDSQDKVIDLIFDGISEDPCGTGSEKGVCEILNGATVDTEGYHIDAGDTTITLPLTEEEVKNILEGKDVRLTVSLNTIGVNGAKVPVRFYEAQKMYVNMFAEIEGEFTIKLK